MGEPSDGTLFYGYCWDKEIVFDENANFDATPLLREVASKVDEGWYGCDAQMGTYLSIKETEKTAGQFNPEPIDLGRLWLDQEANRNWRKALLDTFLFTVGVEPPVGDNQPGWWLVARYVS
ncbi:MAG TPA: hypothetical protein VLT57_20240 [Bryobacteraceae bacterium]|nr:hypothetical protein [Bryobacteraceae bacterium]